MWSIKVKHFWEGELSLGLISVLHGVAADITTPEVFPLKTGFCDCRLHKLSRHCCQQAAGKGVFSTQQAKSADPCAAQVGHTMS